MAELVKHKQKIKKKKGKTGKSKEPPPLKEDLEEPDDDVPTPLVSEELDCLLHMPDPQGQGTADIETESTTQNQPSEDAQSKNDSFETKPPDISQEESTSNDFNTHSENSPAYNVDVAEHAEGDNTALTVPEVLKPECYGIEQNESVERCESHKVEEQTSNDNNTGGLVHDQTESSDFSQTIQTNQMENYVLSMDTLDQLPVSQTEHSNVPALGEKSETVSQQFEPSEIGCEEVSASMGAASAVDSLHIDQLVDLDPLYPNLVDLNLDSTKELETMSQLQTLEANNIMFIPCATANESQQGLLEAEEQVKSTVSTAAAVNFGVNNTVFFQNISANTDRIFEQVDSVNSSQPMNETRCHVPDLLECQDGVSRGMQSDVASAHLKTHSHNAKETSVKSIMSEQLQEPLLLPLDNISQLEQTRISEPTMEKVISPLTPKQHQSLYFNQELMKNDHFIENFVQMEIKKEGHEFYEILTTYLRGRKDLVATEEEIHAFQRDYNQCQEDAWLVTKCTVNGKGTCGDKVNVTGTYHFDVCQFNTVSKERMKQALENTRLCIQDRLSLHSYSSQLSRLQVESYIHNLFLNSPSLRDIPRNAPVSGQEQQRSDIFGQVKKLKDCISILFNFHRQPIREDEFVKNTRSWTERLVSALLRIACLDDHLFILNHVLRCPAGVGQWAASLVQIPEVPPAVKGTAFGNHVLDHMITVMATIMMPVKARQIFICQMKEAITPDGHGESSAWILVDSDGEEDEDPSNAWFYLHENDLVAILKQVPLAALFEHVLYMSREGDTVYYDINACNEAAMLRLIIFSSCLVSLLGQGLQTYNMARYRQFNKRLGRMIRQCVQYVSDHWENFLKNHKCNSETIQQLQVEYDQFFMRAAHCVLCIRRLGSMQFMTDMPYTTLSRSLMWQLLWLLHQGFDQPIDLEAIPNINECKKFIKDPDSQSQLVDIISRLPVSEVIYLLTGLTNMAQNRKAEEQEFILAVTLELLEVTYINAQTREMCYKVGRELLTSLASSHPFILSQLLQHANAHLVELGKMVLYLFKGLPFHLWLPSEIDLNVLRSWLLKKDLSSLESQVAQIIYSSMNWGTNQQEDHLFLAWDIHRQVAVVLVEAYTKFVLDKKLTAALMESVKQVATVVSQSLTNEQQFNNWAWEMALSLSLHQTSLPSRDTVAAVNTRLPDLNSDNMLLPVVKGMKDKNSMACYVALSLTLCGHSIQEFISDGLPLLTCLIDHYHYRAAVHVLSCISGMFVEAPAYLLKNERFLKVIQSLIIADESIIKMAKSLISSDFPGEITKMFSSMIQNHMSLAILKGDGSGPEVVTMWLKVLLKVTKWYNDRNCCYVLDQLIKTAFLCKGGIDVVTGVFQEEFQLLLKESQHHGVVSSLVSWIASGVTLPSFIEKSTSEFGWLAYIVLNLEGRFEEETTIWSGLVNEMCSSPTQGPEQSLKKALMSMKMDQAPAFHRLNIYRWGQQALDTPIDHPVLPLIWQRFFVLFLGRLTTQASLPQRASVGEKFFESFGYTSVLKHMKKKLRATADHHMKIRPDLEQMEDTVDEQTQGLTGEEQQEEENRIESTNYVPRQQFHQELARLYQTYQFWLDEPRLHDANLYLPALPPQYDALKLQNLFQCDKNPWLEFLDLDRLEYELSQSVSHWRHTVNPKQFNPILRRQSMSPTFSGSERILSRLKRHDVALEPPNIWPIRAPVPDISISILEEKSAVMHLLDSDLSSLKTFAKSYGTRMSRHMAIDMAYQDSLPHLYFNQERQVEVYAECKSSINPMHRCRSPACIPLIVKEKVTREIVSRQIDENRVEYKQLIIEGLLPPPQNVCIAAVHVENAITMLVKLFRSTTDDSRRKVLNDIACTLFFHLADFSDFSIRNYVPTRQFFASCIDMLGNEFVQLDPHQTETILNLCLDKPVIVGYLSPHYLPNNSPELFVSMYDQLIHVLEQKNTDLVFVLLTKFDVEHWFCQQKPSQIAVKKFTEALTRGLSFCGAEVNEKFIPVFELYYTHLQLFLRHEFPTHLYDVLSLILQVSSEQKLSVRCWQLLCDDCFVRGRTLSAHSVKGLDTDTLVDTVVSVDQIKGTLHWLSSYFQNLRVSGREQGAFGLYPKWRKYVTLIAQFLLDMMKSLILKVMPSISGMSAVQVLEIVWQQSIETFSPWIQPLDTDSGILSPWISIDKKDGRKMVVAFRKTAEFIHQNFKGVIPAKQRGMLSYMWIYYATILAKKKTPDYVVTQYNEELKMLPWQHMHPDIHVCELMSQVKEMNSPDSFELLVDILPLIDWQDVLQMSQILQPLDIQARLESAILLMLTQCFSRQQKIQNENTTKLFLMAEKYSWMQITSQHFQHTSGWFLQTCEPKCVLSERSSDSVMALRLLKAASGFSVENSCRWSPDLSAKRHSYIYIIIQLICQCSFQPDVNTQALHMSLMNLLTEIETVENSVVATNAQQEESFDLMKEVFSLLNNCHPDGSSLPVVMTTILDWIQSSPHSILLIPSIRAACRSLAAIGHVTKVVERCIEANFTTDMRCSHGECWYQILSAVQVPELSRSDFIETCLQDGAYLLLYSYLLQQLPLCQDLSAEKTLIEELLEWTGHVKPSNENEAKLLLWWYKTLSLIMRQLDFSNNQAVCVQLLRKLVNLLHQTGEDRMSGGLLGAIGLGKKSVLNLRYRLIAKAMAAFLVSQIIGDTTLRIAPGASISSSPQTKQELTNFYSLRNNKQYQPFKADIQMAYELMTDQSKAVQDSLFLLQKMRISLYPEVQYLAVIDPHGTS